MTPKDIRINLRCCLRHFEDSGDTTRLSQALRANAEDAFNLGLMEMYDLLHQVARDPARLPSLVSYLAEDD